MEEAIRIEDGRGLRRRDARIYRGMICSDESQHGTRAGMTDTTAAMSENMREMIVAEGTPVLHRPLDLLFPRGPGSVVRYR
jgi:hypothetical protein